MPSNSWVALMVVVALASFESAQQVGSGTARHGTASRSLISRISWSLSPRSRLVLVKLSSSEFLAGMISSTNNHLRYSSSSEPHVRPPPTVRYPVIPPSAGIAPLRSGAAEPFTARFEILPIASPNLHPQAHLQLTKSQLHFSSGGYRPWCRHPSCVAVRPP